MIKPGKIRRVTTGVSARVLARRATALKLLLTKATGVDVSAEEETRLSKEGEEKAGSICENNSENNSYHPSTTTTIATTAIGFGINGYTGVVCTCTRIAADIHFIVTKVHNRGCITKKAMLFASFTAEESNHKSLQRRVIRFAEKLSTGPPQ